MKKFISIFVLIFTVFSASLAGMKTEGWLWRYSYVDDIRMLSKNFPAFSPTEDYFLVVLVDAQHADYTSSSGYLMSLAATFVHQHYLDPGHAWIVLAGIQDGKPWIFEGGHTVDCREVTKYYAKNLQDDLVNGKYVDVSKAEFSRIAEALEARKKDAILHIRINSGDLDSIKNKAQKLGIKYQTFISEILHRLSKA